MATQALYRAWRPTRFADVFGQDAIVTTLKNQIASGRIGHAYLFCGSRGTGKTTMAKLFARAVNCTETVDGEPCGACAACLALSAENNMDVIEIDAASNNGVDEIRDLRDRINYPPQHGRFRVYIIDEVHMLSTGAFNALLKTLEEPPTHAIFILATTEVRKLPATVLSRCQRYDFRRIKASAIIERLRVVIQGEGVNATPEALSLIARAAEGAMRDALGLLDMCISYGGGSVDAALVREMTGAADREFLFDFAARLIAGDAAGAIRGIDELMRAGREPQGFAKDVTEHLRGLLLSQISGAALSDLLEITGEDAERFAQQAADVSKERLLTLLELFIALEADMRFTSQPRVALEIAAARACMPEEGLRLDPLTARVDLLEKKLAEGIVPAAKPKQGAPMPEAPSPAAQPAAAQATTAQPVAAKPAPLADTALWDAAVALIQREPSLYSAFLQGKLMGIAGDVVAIEFTKENVIYLDLLKRKERLSRLEEIFTQAAGRPITLTLSMKGEAKGDRRMKEDVLQSVYEAFGRENVQVVDKGILDG